MIMTAELLQRKEGVALSATITARARRHEAPLHGESDWLLLCNLMLSPYKACTDVCNFAY